MSNTDFLEHASVHRSSAPKELPSATADRFELTELTGRLLRPGSGSIRFLDRGELSRRTHAELRVDIDSAVATLKGWGVRAGSRVGILAPNSYAWVVFDLALLELRALTVAIPEHWLDDCVGVAERFSLTLLLMPKTSVAARTLPNWIRYLDAPDERPVEPRAVKEAEAEPEFSESTIVFSSGTAGRLKALRISRKGIDAVVSSFARAYPTEPTDCLLVFLPLSNLQQRVMVYGALWFGVEIILATPQQLFRALKEGRPTLVIAPPVLYETIHSKFLALPAWRRAAARGVSLLAGILPRPLGARLRHRVFASIHDVFGGRVRLMITGMAHIRRSTLDFFAAAGFDLFEAYGLTECGIVAGNRAHQARRGSVGKPFDPGSVRIGADREIIVQKTHPLALGYVDDADELEVFATSTTVHTGDIGHFDRDGFLYIDGRKKEMLVTSGGYKLHPEVLEAELHGCHLIERSAVVLLENGSLLCAVVVPRVASTRVERELNAFVHALNQRLPDAGRIERVVLRPEAFSVEDGTLTRNLKLNRTVIAASVASSG